MPKNKKLHPYRSCNSILDNVGYVGFDYNGLEIYVTSSFRVYINGRFVTRFTREESYDIFTEESKDYIINELKKRGLVN